MKLSSLGPEACYFEDLEIGAAFDSPTRTVTEADVVNFACLSADFNRLHIDAEYAKGTFYGQRIAHGLLVLSILSGLSTRTPLMQALGDAMIGLAGLECRWKKATKIGDTLRVRLTVVDLKRSSKGDRGVVTLNRDAVNQHDEVVMESVWTLLVKCREAGSGA